MTVDFLAKLFEHNQWANLQILQACSNLSDEQLDAAPHSATYGSIRQVLVHLVSAQRGYLALLTLPVEARPRGSVEFAKLEEAARASGEGLLALARDETLNHREPVRRTRDDYNVEPWVVMLQVINHATEHREQIKSLLSAQGITPPEIDGWDYGTAAGALVPVTH